MKSVDTKYLAQVLLDTTDGMGEEVFARSVKDFAQYLEKKGLFSLVDEIISQYTILYNKKHNIIEATVTSAKQLPGKTKQELQEALKKKYNATEIAIKEKLDEEIIGGIKIKIGDTVLDNSLSNSLYQLETQLLK
jgi:F-type H+-transporting ATPase subunit delta